MEYGRVPRRHYLILIAALTETLPAAAVPCKSAWTDAVL
jgi:hypothetical protein